MKTILYYLISIQNCCFLNNKKKTITYNKTGLAIHKKQFFTFLKETLSEIKSNIKKIKNMKPRMCKTKNKIPYFIVSKT